MRSAVERQLGILGEALSALSKLDPALAERVPEVRAIIGMRHVLIHRYARVDHAIVWAAVNERVPRLLQLLRQLTASL